MWTKARMIHAACRTVTGAMPLVMGRVTALRLRAHIVEDVIPIVERTTPAGSLKFFCPSPTPEWRARELLTKEPDTILWLDSFRRSDVLWDIGANVGVYTLYAALKGVTVLAFEPSPANYYTLARNLELNGFGDRVASYCVAFNDRTELNRLFMASTEPGSALNNFGRQTDWKGDAFTPVYSQGMVGFTVDEFMDRFQPPFPTHIKIDVDGNEHRILRGATKVLASQELQSLLVELDPAHGEYPEVVRLLQNAGLHLVSTATSDTSSASEFSRVHNHIFRRRSA